MTEAQIEARARIIDPQAWALYDHGMINPVWGDIPRLVSLEKARQIAALVDAKDT